MKLRKRKLHATVESLEDMDDPPDHEGAKHTDQIGRWDETPADELLSKELRALIEKAIAKLPMDYRVVFVLRDIEGKSTEETARILSLSIEATKSRLRRARAFLRAQLNPYMTS
jgi:RNA polymerase sigma-70 factor (ECF subfamily)